MVVVAKVQSDVQSADPKIGCKTTNKHSQMTLGDIAQQITSYRKSGVCSRSFTVGWWETANAVIVVQPEGY